MVEEAVSAPFETPEGFILDEERAMGETVLRFLLAAPEKPAT